ncbi:MAG: hypothetical protein ABEJ83_05145 [Candidatus Nanohaloarchaea archaeon]
MEPSTGQIKTLAIGTVAGAAAYKIYTVSTLESAFLTLIASAWMLHKLSTPKKLWNTISSFSNPVYGFMNAFLPSFVYLSYKGLAVTGSLFLSTVIGIFTAVFSIWWAANLPD